MMKPTRITIFFLCLAVWSSSLYADVAGKNQINAAYLYHIINFVQWPDTGSTDNTAPRRINVCVVGDTGFASSLAPLTKRTIARHRIEVTVNPPLAIMHNCRVLYFANTTAEQTKHWLIAACRYAILTLGDVPGFARAGGMIGLFAHENTVRMEVNTRAAAHAGLSFSAKLLEVALNIIKDKSVDCP